MAPVRLHVAQHEHDDPIVEEGAAQVGEDGPKELQVGSPQVRLLEGRADRRRVECQEPEPEPTLSPFAWTMMAAAVAPNRRWRTAARPTFA